LLLFITVERSFHVDIVAKNKFCKLNLIFYITLALIDIQVVSFTLGSWGNRCLRVRGCQLRQVDSHDYNTLTNTYCQRFKSASRLASFGRWWSQNTKVMEV